LEKGSTPRVVTASTAAGAAGPRFAVGEVTLNGVPTTWRLGLRAILAVACLALGGCATIGPATIPRDRFDYTAAVSESWKNQMLLNMVKLRYADVPVFLDVTSVINQYAIEGEVSGAASSQGGFTGGDFFNLGGRARYADRPTITYQPLTGDKFTRSLLTPMQPHTIVSLVQGGHRVDYLFAISVRAVNGIANASATAMLGRKADPRFEPLIKSLRALQALGAIGMRMEKSPDGETAVFVFREAGDEDVAETVQAVRDTLGLDADTNEFTLVPGFLSQGPGEIAIQGRSFLEILAELAARFDVPPQHVSDGRVAPTPELAPGSLEERYVIRVHVSEERPKDAFAAVPYRDHWFWIDDRDIHSKRRFSFLMILSSLAETGRKEPAPVLTIPAG
jgi:hypothetical protein